MNYTIEEKYQIVVWYHSGARILHIQNLFMEMFPNRPLPSRCVIQHIMKNLQTRGCLSWAQHPKVQPTVKRFNPDRELRDIMICATVDQNPSLSLRDIAEEFRITSVTVSNVLKANGYKTVKLHRANELSLNDIARRMQFCERITEKANRNEDFIKNILFTGETSFQVYARHNPSGTRYWSREKDPCFNATPMQPPKKLTVWAGIIGNKIIGPFFVDGSLNAQKYMNLLQDHIIPEIRALKVPFEKVWFQQDATGAHNSSVVRLYLNDIFSSHLLAGFVHFIPFKGIPWPSRSPDLAPTDFFLWAYTRSKIYGLNTNAELRTTVVNALKKITPDMLSNMRTSFYNRLGYCTMQMGNRFEYLL